MFKSKKIKITISSLFLSFLLVLLVVFQFEQPETQAAINTLTFQKGDEKESFSETDDGLMSSASGADSSANNFKLGRKDSALYRTVIKFPNIVGTDANQVPAGVKVTNAVLKLKTGSGAYYHTVKNVTVEAHKILESWDEVNTGNAFIDSPSWNNKVKGLNSDDPNARWANAGAGTPTSSSGIVEGSVNLGGAYNTVYSINVTQTVQDWVSLSSPNYGLVLRLTDETTLDTSKIFYSSEAINVADRPILEITYEMVDPQDVSAPTILSSSPSGILPQDTTSATLSVKTNENATCKYSTTANTPYGTMTAGFISSDYQNHTTTLSGLVPGSHNYYVKCIDFSSNVMTSDHVITFSITPDSTPPGQITNLAVSDYTSNSCVLSWTASGDDGNSGKSSSYDIRYSLNPITDLNWSSATQIFGEPQPQSSGTIQTATINGLAPGTKFYFGIKSADEAPNHSIVSNVVNGTTLSLSQGASMKVWTSTGMEKIRPFDAQGANTSVSLSSSINEYEPFQVTITSENEKIEDVDVTVNLPAPFTSSIYKEDFMHIVTPSNMYGDTGEWPDILIPKVDTYYGETRNAFPMQVSNISRAYPLIASLPQQSYGPGKDGIWFSNIEPPSKFVYPYDGNSKGGGKSGNNNQGTGKVSTGGVYHGSSNARYIVVIESSGSINTAKFKWSPDGGLNFNGGVPVSSSPILLDNGITLNFSGAGLDTDFIAGDEWIFYASPKRNQPVWIDVYAPKNTQPGNYSGSVTITAKNKITVTIPINIRILDFQLPDTASLKNYFGLGSNFTRGHKVPDGVPLDHLYTISGLRHRISLSNAFEAEDAINGGMACWSYNEASGAMTINFDQFDAKIGPFLAGTGTTPLYPNIPFPGKLTIFTSQYIHFGGCPAVDVDKRTRIANKLFADHLKEKGWFDRWHIYLYDEPSFSNQLAWDTITARGISWKSSVPDVPLFVTTTLDYGTKKNVLDYIDAFVDLHITADYNNQAGRRAFYDNWLATPDTPRHELWSYVACGSCWNVGGSYFKGESNHGIDYTPNQLRIRTWLDRFYNVEAELYYAVNENWNRYPLNNLDPWENAYWFGNNGDGQLFYPGRPDKIGGTTHIPVESLRLKLVRESFEDYEYMYKLDQSGEKNFVNNELAKIITNSVNFSLNPNDIYSVRAAMAGKIESLNNSGTSTPDLIAPVISSTQATTTINSAIVTWTTNEPADSKVEYGLTTSYGQITSTTSTLSLSHSKTVSGLTSNTIYHYRVISTDASGNQAISPDYTFKTLYVPDTTSPTAVSDLASSEVGQTSLTISWTVPTDDSGIASYDLRYSLLPITSTNFSSSNQFNALPTPKTYGIEKYEAVGLTPGTKYHFALKSKDSVGNISPLSNVITITTLAVPSDRSNPSIPPTPPTSTKINATDGQVSLSWKNPTDADFVRVKILRKTGSYSTSTTDGIIVYEGKDTSFVDTGLSNGTEYFYTIYAYDSIPNYSTPIRLNITPKGSTTQISILKEQKQENNIDTKTSIPPYPAGTLLRDSASKRTYYIDTNGSKRLIASPSVFSANGFNWKNVIDTDSLTLDRYTDGEILRDRIAIAIPIATNSTSTVPVLAQKILNIPTAMKKALLVKVGTRIYSIVNNQKYPILSPSMFNAYQYTWNKVKNITPTQLGKYARVKLIKAVGSSAVYYITDRGQKKVIPSADIFLAYGNKWKDIVEIFPDDLAKYEDVKLIKLEGDAKIYLLENNTKHHVKSMDAINRMKLKIDDVVTIKKIEFDAYTTGEDAR